MTVLDAETRTRLLKLLGMTGSAHEGEQLAALRKVLKLMADKKLTWGDLLATGTAPPQPAPRAQPQPQPKDGFYGFDMAAGADRTAYGFGGGRRWDRNTEFRWNTANPPGAGESVNAEELYRQAQEARDALDSERIAVRIARERLDAILKRRKLTPTKAAHFDAIRKHHQQTGHINPSHRAQIDRAFFTEGWDEPLGAGAGGGERTAKAENNADRKARAWADLKAAMGGAGVQFVIPDDLMDMLNTSFSDELRKGGYRVPLCGLCGKNSPTTKLASTSVCQSCWDKFATPEERAADAKTTPQP